jgi:peptidoglycan/LPS O-acetylase OafA/YrhL
MHTTWYLSVEYQMFLIAPLFVYALWKTDGRAMGVIYGIVVAISLFVLKVSLEEHFIIRDFDV